MKNVLFILLMAVTNIIGAQTIIPLEQQKDYIMSQAGQNYYYKDVNHVLDKFLGSWKYQNATSNPTEVVEVIFYKKVRDDHNGNYYIDELFAHVKYTKNGQVIFNTLPQPAVISYGDTFGDFFEDPENTNKIRLQYYEPNAPSPFVLSSSLYIEYLPGTPARIDWKMKWHAMEPDVATPVMPPNMVLTKIN